MIEDAFVTYLKAHVGLKALIVARLYPEIVPQGDLRPAVVYQCISDIKIHTHQGQASTEEPNYQFTVYADTRASARLVSDQLKLALCDYKGLMSATMVNYITLINELPSIEISSDGTMKLHTVDLEFQINYERS
jgi:hypothetical protein